MASTRGAPAPRTPEPTSALKSRPEWDKTEAKAMNTDLDRPDAPEAARHLLAAARGPLRHSRRTPDCPSTARLAAAHDAGDWTAPERAHVAGCDFCRGCLSRLDEL